MSIADTVCGRVFVSLEHVYPASSELALLAHPDCCGVVLFEQNYQDVEQVGELCSAIRACRDDDLLIGIDREGGRLQRLGEPFTRLPAAYQLGRLYAGNQSQALRQAAELALLRARELHAVGIDFAFAPVLDLYKHTSSVIGERALGAKPDRVAALGLALIEGAHKAGSLAVAKHFPGHGSIKSDSHFEACTDGRSYASIKDADLHPFAAAIEAGVDAVMSAHIRYPKCDERVATYSPFWAQEVLRQGLGFKGLLMSDDLCMAGAARGDGDSPGEIAARALAAIDAGHDIVLVCRNYEAAEATLHAIARRRGSEPPFRRHIGRSGAPASSWRQLQSDQEYLRIRDNLHRISHPPAQPPTPQRR